MEDAGLKVSLRVPSAEEVALEVIEEPDSEVDFCFAPGLRIALPPRRHRLLTHYGSSHHGTACNGAKWASKFPTHGCTNSNHGGFIQDSFIFHETNDSRHRRRERNKDIPHGLQDIRELLEERKERGCNNIEEEVADGVCGGIIHDSASHEARSASNRSGSKRATHTTPCALATGLHFADAALVFIELGARLPVIHNDFSLNRLSLRHLTPPPNPQAP